MIETDRNRERGTGSRRPYLSATTRELEELAHANRDRATVLRAIRREVGFRRRQRALRLSARIDRRLSELTANVGSSSEGAAQPIRDLQPSQKTRDPRTYDLDAVSVGVLAASGYRVGKYGVSTESRRAALDRIIQHEITDVEDVAYVATWGRPGSPERLRRTAYVLAKLARGARKRGPTLTTARVAWSMDLGFLKAKYFDGQFEGAFAWPSDRT